MLRQCMPGPRNGVNAGGVDEPGLAEVNDRRPGWRAAASLSRCDKMLTVAKSTSPQTVTVAERPFQWHRTDRDGTCERAAMLSPHSGSRRHNRAVQPSQVSRRDQPEAGWGAG